MSSYYPSFNYLGINSKDKNLIVAHFDSDSGEKETFLSMEPIYVDNAHGTQRIDYGAKYNSVPVFKLSLIKQDHSSFLENEIRDCLKWLTGNRANSRLELLVEDEVKYSFIGRITNMWQQKLDARTIGLVAEFTSVAPWAYSPVQTLGPFNGSGHPVYFDIDNQSDDLYTYIYPKITYTNTYTLGGNGTSSALTLTNITYNEKTEINNIAYNETVTLSNGQYIISDSSRIVGDDFNNIFPCLRPGLNSFMFSNTGILTVEYVYPIKIGDCAMDINNLID